MDSRALVEARRLAMRRASEAFVDGRAYPDAVYRALESRGVSRSSAVLVDDRTASEECCEGVYAGLLLTVEGRFIRFEVDVSDPQGDVVVEDFCDVTSDTSAERRLPGVGTSDGWLAHELVEELQAEGRLTRACS
jgi:hypothetical protein